MRQTRLTPHVSTIARPDIASGATSPARAGISKGVLKETSLSERKMNEAWSSMESHRKIKKIIRTFPFVYRSDFYNRLWIAMYDIDKSGTGNEIASQFHDTAASLDASDRVFFTAYFVTLCENELQRNPAPEKIDWKSLLGIAEKEAREGSKFAPLHLAKQFTLNDEGTICSSTSPNFELGLFFRNVSRLVAEVPALSPIKTFPSGNKHLLPDWLSSNLGIGELGCRAAYDRLCVPSDYKNVKMTLKSASGANYLLMREYETVNVYRYVKSYVFAKGFKRNNSMPVWLYTGEFNVFSPRQNRFFHVKLNPGEPACLLPCLSHLPSPSLAKMFLDAEAEDKLRRKGSNRQKL